VEHDDGKDTVADAATDDDGNGIGDDAVDGNNGKEDNNGLVDMDDGNDVVADEDGMADGNGGSEWQ
jgi:hypothetical protein